MITDLHYNVDAQLALAKMHFNNLQAEYKYVSLRLGIPIKRVCELSAEFDMHEELLRDNHYD